MRRHTLAPAALLLCALALLLPLRSFAAAEAQAPPLPAGDGWDGRFATPAMLPELFAAAAGDGSLYYLQSGDGETIYRWDGAALRTIGRADEMIVTLAYGAGSLYAGGYFGAIDGVAAPGLARWDAATETWHGIARSGGPIYGLLPAGNSVYTAGPNDEQTATFLDRWDVAAQTWQRLATLPGTEVSDLLIFNGSLYLSFAEGPAGVVRVDLASNTWRALLDQQQSADYRYELAASGSALFVARAPAGPQRSFIEVFSYADTTGALQPFGALVMRPNPSYEFDMLFADGALYVAGAIERVNTTALNGVARWDGVWWDRPGAGPAPTDGAPLLFDGRRLVHNGSSLLVTGLFRSPAGAPFVWEPGAARWAPASATWEPVVADPTALGVDGWVQALAAVGDDLYVGGKFAYAGATPSMHLARLDTRTLTWHALGGPSPVTALSARDGRLYVGYAGNAGVEEIDLATGARRSLGGAWLSYYTWGERPGVTFLAATASGLYAADGSSLVHLTDRGWVTLLGKTTQLEPGDRGELSFNVYTADDQYVYSANHVFPPRSGCNYSTVATIPITRWKGAVREDLPGVSGPYVWELIAKSCVLVQRPFVYGLLPADGGLYIYGAFDEAGGAPAEGWTFWRGPDGGPGPLPPLPGPSRANVSDSAARAVLARGVDGPVALGPAIWNPNDPFLATPALWEWRDGGWRRLGFAGTFGGALAAVGCDLYAGARYARPPWPGPSGGLARLARTCRAAGVVRTTRGAPVAGVGLSAGAARAVTLGDGAYSFAALPAGTVAITPAREGFVFDPPARSVTFPTISEKLDFTLLPAPVSAALTPGQPASLSYTDVNGLPVTLDVPAGATGASSLTLAAAAPGQLPPRLATTGHVLEVRTSPDDPAPFARGLALTIAYGDEDLRQLFDEAQLRLYRWDGQAWAEQGAACRGDGRVDTAANRFSATLCAPGRYMLAGPARGVALPLVRR
jgi:hypothetical protein